MEQLLLFRLQWQEEKERKNFSKVFFPTLISQPQCLLQDVVLLNHDVCEHLLTSRQIRGGNELLSDPYGF